MIKRSSKLEKIKKAIDKEHSEVESIFNCIKKHIPSSENLNILNLASGNGTGLELTKEILSQYNYQITCLDIKKFKHVDKYVEDKIYEFIQDDLLNLTLESKQIMTTKNVWMAIHACYDLPMIILSLFEQYAPTNSWLFIVPCCNIKKFKLMSKLINIYGENVTMSFCSEFKKNAENIPYKSNYIMREMRTKILINSPYFVDCYKLPTMKSLMNLVFIYHK